MGKTLKVDITAISPLNIGSKKPYGHFLETLDYIPGSVVRGAFAKMMMKSNKVLFDKLFVESQDVICFGNFYPKTSLNAPDVPLVLPMTAVSCKYEDGFCTGYDEILLQDDRIKKQAGIDETKEPPHGVFDTLIEENQIRNVLNVAANTKSVEVIEAFIQYQIGRSKEKKWASKSEENTICFGDALICELEKLQGGNEKVNASYCR